jgi:hypothetical protein
MIHEFKNPTPVTTPMGDGYLFYVRDGGTWENDVFAVVLEDGGRIFHFKSDQIRMYANKTFNIQKSENICQQTTAKSRMPNYLH